MNDPTSAGIGSRTLELVRQGMRVVDAAGQEVGPVEFVSMGDPGAATTQGNDIRTRDTFLSDIARAVSAEIPEPQLEPPLRDRFLRLGFIKIDGSGLSDTDRYASSEMVAGVSGDTVRLSVTRDQLAVEAS